MIPKIMFRTSSRPRDQLSIEVKKLLQDNKNMNKDYLQVYIDDEQILQFIKDEYPQYLELYLSLVPGAYKADVFRLLVLYKYGGVYNDIGHRYLTPVTDFILPEDEFVAATEVNRRHSFGHAIYNGLLAAYVFCYTIVLPFFL